MTVFEAFHAAGGVLIYGIPEFRLPKDIVHDEVTRLEQHGRASIEPNSIVGKTYTLDELRATFDAVFIAIGAGLPVFMDVPGENLKGVYSANEYLTRVNLMGAYGPDATRRCCRASASPWSAAATSPWTRCARPSAWARTRPSIVYRRGDGRDAGAARGSPPRRAGRHPVRAADGAGRGHRRERLGDRAELPCAWSWASPTHSGRRRPVPVAGSRVRDRLRHGGRGHRHAQQPLADRVRAPG